MSGNPSQPFYPITPSELDTLSKCSTERCDGSCKDDDCPIRIAERVRERGMVTSAIVNKYTIGRVKMTRGKRESKELKAQIERDLKSKGEKPL